MQGRLLVAVAVAIALTASCGGSPVGPTTPPAPQPAPAPAPVPAPAPSPRVVTGRIVDALSGNPQASLQVSVEGVGAGATNTSGEFNIEVPASFADTTTIRFQGPNIVFRTSRVKVPGGPVTLSTMQSGFALAAFDEMFRHTSGSLTRWVEAPRLVVQRRVLQFTSAELSNYTATSELMTDAQASDLVSTLVAALPALTGGRFTSFANQISETANAGDSVSITRTGDVFVAHFKDLASPSAVAYGRWSYDARYIVRGGILMLDRDYDISSPRRRSTRAHELGHALGYNHVTTRESVMNTPSMVEPTDWDRDASKIAFQREPGNRSPDDDPVWFTSNPIAGGRVVWSQAVP
jgi:predicted Zn-dependent protease